MTKKKNIKPVFFNRELSWLKFNARVLEQALSKKYPLLERLRLMSFVSSNLDEFFEIRVAGLIQQFEAETPEKSIDGLSPKEQLDAIREQTMALVEKEYDEWNNSLVPKLKKEGILFKEPEHFSKTEEAWAESYFEKEIYPVLTPLGIGPTQPFPEVVNKILNVLVWLDDPKTPQIENFIAIVPVPRALPRVVEINPHKGKTQTYAFLGSIIKKYAYRLFPGFKTNGSWLFRVTRNSDLYIDEEEVENLLKTIEEELHKLKKGAAVRLEIENSIHPELLKTLLAKINLNENYVYKLNGPINLMRLFGAYERIHKPELKHTASIPNLPEELTESSDIFQAIRNKDILLHHPYDSFTPIETFIKQAAKDPKVLAIKQTLYRVDSDSPILEALTQAAANGKQVTIILELKARFDEANNILFARKLEEAGVHVVYGQVGLKTHCKCCLIVRKEEDKIRQYVHFGTGNYNSKTAKSYTDLSLFTADKEITEDAANLFNTLTGFGRPEGFKHLLVAPYNMHSELIKYLDKEIKNAKNKKPAYVFAKLNNLLDEKIISKLYEASQAGVKIDLIVRSICCLVPGIKGLSENIQVKSILGPYLEHSRIFYFENHGSASKILIGSADWMPRNFYRRIETLVPIKNESVRKSISKIIKVYQRDNESAKILQPNGEYKDAKKTEKSLNAQKSFLESAQKGRLALRD